MQRCTRQRRLEPAETVIANFGNAPETEPMAVVAFYLRDGDQELIRMLNEESS
jgi:hypothetical protein